MRLMLVLSLLVVFTAPGQIINHWINPGSSRWDSASSWSLGRLPAFNQSVNVTNDGYKAVNIDSATVAGYPGSLVVGNLTVSAPSNALSTVLLNYSGLNIPLKILNGLSIGPNGALQNSYGSLEVDGTNGGTIELSGGGAWIQQGGQTTASVPINLRNGSIFLTNGNMSLGPVAVGLAGSSDTSSMIQNGGSVAVDTLTINHGAYNLYQGILYGINGTTIVSTNGASFYQGGGTNFGNIYLGSSVTYTLDSGMCQGNVLSSGGFSQFQQNGGLVNMEFLNITGPEDIITIGDAIGYYLRQGETRCGTLNIGGNGLVQQDGGLFVLTNKLDLRGMFFNVGDYGPLIEHAYFILVNGTFSSPALSVGPYAAFNQRGGSNEISGPLTIFSEYHLPGGMLETTGTGVGLGGYFDQFRGSHYVHGVLSISGTYDLLGGPLHVNGLYLRGTLSISDAYQQADFVNEGLTDLGGSLHAASFVVFGQVQLSTNALFDLTSGSARVHCQNSSSVAWTSGMFLVISNWHATGPNAVYFGTDSKGLTASQLAQIQFSNPGGLAPGTYSATILPSGEIVPGQIVPGPSSLALQRATSGLTLSWTSGTLQSATNIAGPFDDVPSATSPYSILTSKSAEFFRLKP